MKLQRCDISGFGKRLRQLRMERCLSMDTFCEQYNKTNSSRLSKSTVSRWENGTQEPKLSTVSSLAAFFGVQPMYLLGDSDERECTASNIQNSAVVQGNNATTLIVRNGKDSETTLSEQETELLRIYQSLSVKGQTKLLTYAFGLESEEGE